MTEAENKRYDFLMEESGMTVSAGPRVTRRRAAEAEGGMPVSAGVRLADAEDKRYDFLAADDMPVPPGRVLSVDLSDVPEAKRAEVADAIRELVGKARASGHQSANPAPSRFG